MTKICEECKHFKGNWCLKFRHNMEDFKFWAFCPEFEVLEEKNMENQCETCKQTDGSNCEPIPDWLAYGRHKPQEYKCPGFVE